MAAVVTLIFAAVGLGAFLIACILVLDRQAERRYRRTLDRDRP